MRKISTQILLLVCMTLGLSHWAAAAKLSNQQQVADCKFTKSGSWWNTAYSSLPASIANNPVTGSPEFCEFYQFAQDWFLYLISPSANNKKIANWQDPQQYPLLETAGTNSCDAEFPKNAFNLRTVKSSDPGGEFVLPERIDQAGGVYAIYDQQGNVVFYEVRFSKNLCDYKKIQQANNFPGKTAELKMAWRILTKKDKKSDYYTTKAKINGKNYTLGLIGWHIVVAADNHPEMVWITMDHKGNAVECDAINGQQTGYDFTSSNCAQNMSSCINLNKTLKSTSITLPSGTKPNDICQEFKYGTLAGQGIDTPDGLNVALVEKLNTNMDTIFAASGLPKSLKIWSEYRFTGALWVSDIAKGSSDSSNQRGSLELANTVMETEFQGQSGTAGSSVNCFGCHNYSATSSNTATNAGLSHIFDDVITGQCKDVTATSLINNQQQAEQICPGSCSGAGLKWNGQWTNQNAKTGAQLPMTVCGCCAY